MQTITIGNAFSLSTILLYSTGKWLVGIRFLTERSLRHTMLRPGRPNPYDPLNHKCDRTKKHTNQTTLKGRLPNPDPRTELFINQSHVKAKLLWTTRIDQIRSFQKHSAVCYMRAGKHGYLIKELFMTLCGENLWFEVDDTYWITIHVHNIPMTCNRGERTWLFTRGRILGAAKNSWFPLGSWRPFRDIFL